MHLEIFTIDAFGPAVGGSATAPRYCQLGGVIKLDTDAAPYTAANELICARLASMIGLPVPPGTIVRGDNGETGYVSLRFGRAGEQPPPVIPEHFVEDHPDLAAGVVAFDCWVGNTDRHNQNLAYSRGNLPPVVFDHSHALFGGGTDTSHLNRPEDPRVNGSIARLLTSDAGLRLYAERIGSVPQILVQLVIRELESQEVLSPEDANLAGEFLETRRGKLLELLQSAGEPLSAVQWGMNL